MDSTLLRQLDLAEGPVFRFALALALLGLARRGFLAISDTVAAYVTIQDRAEFWRKLRQRMLWVLLPSIVLQEAGRFRSRGMFAYHLFLGITALVFRAGAILVPTFMVAHVYLWERGLGVSWPSFPARWADVLSLVTIVTGLILFLGRLYSPVLRGIESAWSFFKPLLVVAPFIAGMLAMHPTWSPLDYHVVLLVHVLMATIVLALLPFARLLANIHAPLTQVVPDAQWVMAPTAHQPDDVEAPGLNAICHAGSSPEPKVETE
jgi:hypothetical protein